MITINLANEEYAFCSLDLVFCSPLYGKRLLNLIVTSREETKND